MEDFKLLILWAVSPLIIVIVAQVAGWTLYRVSGRRRSGLWLIASSLIFLVICSLPVLTYESNRAREYVYEPLDLKEGLDPAGAVLVVVMGTGYNPDPVLPQNSRVSGTAHARFMEAVRIYRARPEARLLVSIANIEADPNLKREFLDEMIALFDLDPKRVSLITEAESTEDEARLAAESLREGEQVVIASSAGHMPRAMLTFAKEGLSPVAAPCDFHHPRPGSPRDETWKQWLPSSGGISSTHQFFCESLASLWQVLKPN